MLTFTITGLDEQLAAFPAFEDALKHRIWDMALIPVGNKMLARAIDMAHVDTGLLQSLIRLVYKTFDDLAIALVLPDVARPSQPDHPYDLYREFGTVTDNPPRPGDMMMRGPIYQFAQEMKEAIHAALKQAASEAGFTWTDDEVTT